MNLLSVNLGPFALSSSILLVMAAFLAAIIAARLAGKGQPSIASTLIDMLITGMLVARLVFVVLWFEIYRESPWTILDIRDGGFSVWAGIAAALLLAIWRGWRHTALRAPLSIGLTAGILVWGLLFSTFNMLANPALPDVPLVTLTGEAVELTALADKKPMVINLWASWCPPCRREMPVLAAMQQSETDIQFIFINQGEQAETISKYLRASQLDLDNVLLDTGARFGQTAGSRGLPTTLFYDRHGQLKDSHMGELSAATLASRLNKLREPHSKN